MALKSEKQRIFVQEYLVDLNATQAAIRAGYSPNRVDQTAYNLLRKTEIQAEIAAARSARERRTLVTQDMVIAGLLMEAQDQENGSAATRVSAWEKLGKHLGMFEKHNRREITFKHEDLLAELMD